MSDGPTNYDETRGTYADTSSSFSITAETGKQEDPVPMLLFCPACGTQHVDQPQPEKEWTNPPHRSHECQKEDCGYIWRPADVPTTGVAEISTKGSRDSGPCTPLRTFQLRAADALADEVAVLVDRKVIDSRSRAADALLDYRNPPRSESSNGIANLEAECEARGAILDAIKEAAGLDQHAGWRASIAVLTTLARLRPLEEYHEDFGPVLWWKLPVNEPPWCGTPHDSDWSGYQTHWSPLPKLALDDEGMPRGESNG